MPYDTDSALDSRPVLPEAASIAPDHWVHTADLGTAKQRLRTLSEQPHGTFDPAHWQRHQRFMAEAFRIYVLRCQATYEARRPEPRLPPRATQRNGLLAAVAQ